ncbi:hypothetical protein MINTM021_25770 [Mycobacterium paraintracellulare]|nr:hypothetical protein MINTM021_25770 [Mycobacterium paraintracellulare]
MNGWQAGESPLIVARCGRCYRVAAKYWEGEGWVTSQQTESPITRAGLDERARIRTMVREPGLACRCDPPPALPSGNQLATLVDQALAEPVRPRTLHRHRPAPITVRVT